MYAVVRRYEGVTDVDEAVKRVNDGLVPIIRQVPGYVAYWAIAGGNGTIVSVSVFRDRSGAEEVTRRAADFVKQNLASVLPNPPQVTTGEVVLGEAGKA